MQQEGPAQQVSILRVLLRVCKNLISWVHGCRVACTQTFLLWERSFPAKAILGQSSLMSRRALCWARSACYKLVYRLDSHPADFSPTTSNSLLRRTLLGARATVALPGAGSHGVHAAGFWLTASRAQPAQCLSLAAPLKPHVVPRPETAAAALVDWRARGRALARGIAWARGLFGRRAALQPCRRAGGRSQCSALLGTAQLHLCIHGSVKCLDTGHKHQVAC